MGVAYRFVGCGGYSKWEELIEGGGEAARQLGVADRFVG